MSANFFYFLLILFAAIILCISSSAYSQCLEEGQVFLPETYITNGDLYGHPVTGFENNLLVSASNNDQYEFNGGIAYLYQMNSGTWTKQAEFKPSENILEMYFGRRTAIDKNIIVIAGNTYTPEGYHFDELFVYTKNADMEWSSRTESYRVTLRDDLTYTGLIVSQIVINNDILGVSYYTTHEDNIAFYRIKPDLSLEYITTLNGPSNGVYSGDEFGTDFDFTDDFLAARGNYLDGFSRKSAVMVYNLKKVLDGTDHEPIALLRPASEGHQYFGIQVEVDSGHIYVANAFNYLIPNEYSSAVFIFKKPDAGWTNSFESATLSTETTIVPGYNHVLDVEGDYVFFSNDHHAENKLNIFKKDGEWQDAGPDLIINKDRESENDKRHFAMDYAVFYNHLVVNYLSDYLSTGPDNYDQLISYYAPGGAFENITASHQELSETYNTASESTFGNKISYDKNRMAVGSPGDQVNGRSAGAVYVYDKSNPDDNFDLSGIVRPPDAGSGDAFGYSVELADTLLFVSSPYYDSLNEDGSYVEGSIGKVYLYALEDAQWVLKNTLYSPANISDNDIKHFGISLSYDNGYLAVGQYYSGSSESNGSVYIFRLLENYQWSYVAEMKTKVQQGGDLFGSNIILRDDLLVVGTGNPEHGYTDEMRVYIYQKEGVEWSSKTEDAYLLPSEKHRNDRFGFSIDMHRDLIVVGSPGFNYGNSKTFAGKAYVFQRPEEGWTGRIEEVLILEPKEPREEDFFGYDVHIDENNILIGAASSINNPYSAWSASDIEDLQPGKIYFFDPYSENDKVVKKRNERYIQLSENNRYLDAFGYDLEGAYDRIFVSAIYDNNASGFRAGAVYELKYSTFIYRVKEPICSNGEPFNLKSNRLGGYWSGEGIADSLTGLFDPSLVSQYGWTLVTYNAGDCRVTTSLYIGSLPRIVAQSDNEINKCAEDSVSLFVEYTSAIQSNTKWYYKENIGGNYELIISDRDSLEIIEPGLYKVEIYTGLCEPVIAEFKVNGNKNDAYLNYHDYVEVCSYDNKELILTGHSDIQNISWFFKTSNSSIYDVTDTDNAVLLNKSGDYYATYTIGTCTFNSDTIEVFLNHQDLTLENPGVMCESSEFQLNATPEGGVWTGIEISDEGVIYVQDLSNAIYHANYKLSKGNCTFKDSVQFEVLVMDQPQVQFTSLEVCPGEPVELVALGNSYNADVNWFKVGVDGGINTSDNFSIDKPGEYFAQFSLKGCKTTSDSLKLSIKKDSLFVPNVITINNDRINDEFIIHHTGTINLKLNILNRWGDIIYSDEDEKIMWKAENAPSGVYYWHIQYLDCFEEINSMKGWLQVMK